VRPVSPAGTVSGTRWLPDIGALVPTPPARLASWLTEPGLLTDRLRDHFGGDLQLVLIDQRPGRLAAGDQRALGVAMDAAFVREIELWCAGSARVFAQTLVPIATLDACPWLADLGRTALGETLARQDEVSRGTLEFAVVVPGTAMFKRAWRSAAARPAALWARRSWYAVAGHRLLVQELFLPGIEA
jgi:chorismate--pyruvate lyase